MTFNKREASEYQKQTESLVPADMVYVLFCSLAVFLITPGIGMFYSGLLKRKNVVQVLFQSYVTTCTIIIIWYLLGYSLANSTTSKSKLMGDFQYAALRNEEAKPMSEGGTIPTVIDFCFNVFFPVATAQIFIGAIGERGRFLPSQAIAIIWIVVCYCPLAYWLWASNGWLASLGSLDFAGGGPVHIASGVASLCYSWYLGPREQPGRRRGPLPKFRGNSELSTFIGATFIWAAWFCFNSGTLLSVNVRTGYIFLNTILSSAFGSLTFVVIDYVLTRKYSLNAGCEGAILGLVNITPSCGFYWPWAAAVTAIINAVMCRFLMRINVWTGIDDYSYSGVVHGIGGIIGGTLTGIFATKTVAGYDGSTEIDGGWIDGNWVQIGYQIAAWVSVVAWTVVFTLIILFIVDYIPYLRLRATEEEEKVGMDLLEMEETIDEFANDYEELFLRYAGKHNLLATSYEERNGVVEMVDNIDYEHQSKS